MASKIEDNEDINEGTNMFEEMEKGNGFDETNNGGESGENDGNDDGNDEGENNVQDYDEDNIYAMESHKSEGNSVTKKKNVRRPKRSESEQPSDSGVGVSYDDGNGDYDGGDYEQPQDAYINEDPHARKRRLLEEKMDNAMKTKTVRRKKADEDDLERMQDDRIDYLKDQMIKAANLDVEKNSQGLIATEKLKMLDEVVNVLSKADLAISILDNNLLEAVRLWLEPLPDASMPAYQIQKELIGALVDLPIKTDHLVASGIGKVLVFYQRSKRTDLRLKKIVDQLIGDWTRPILNKSDSYKDRSIHFQDYNKNKFVNKLSSAKPKTKEAKTLYEESAERRNRAAIPTARTTAYKIAPKVDPEVLSRKNQAGNNDERFKRINQKMNFKKKANKKSGPSIEGKNLTL